MSKLKLIAAVGKNNELGKNNDLIWHIKEDLQFFKEKTMAHHIFMGYNTYLSLPKKLEGRKYIVIAEKEKKILDPDVIVVNSLDEFNELRSSIEDDIFVVGGASVYHLMINDCSELYLTEIDDEDSEADVYFPSFDKEKYNVTILSENNENAPKYRHVLYTKKDQ